MMFMNRLSRVPAVFSSPIPQPHRPVPGREVQTREEAITILHLSVFSIDISSNVKRSHRPSSSSDSSVHKPSQRGEIELIRKEEET
jgi:hypothetical protein